jgi:hypothetical protein
MSNRYAPYSRLKIDYPAERILRVTFNRPETFNSVDAETHTDGVLRRPVELAPRKRTSAERIEMSVEGHEQTSGPQRKAPDDAGALTAWRFPRLNIW